MNKNLSTAGDVGGVTYMDLENEDITWRKYLSPTKRKYLPMKITNINNQIKQKSPSMVIFITSLAAYQKMRVTILTAQYPVWCTSGILTASESEALYSADVDLTIFNYEVDIQDQELLEDALSTIREHHGDTEVWLES